MGCREENQWGEKWVEVQNYKKDCINPIMFEHSGPKIEQLMKRYLEVVKPRDEVFLGDRMNRN